MPRLAVPALASDGWEHAALYHWLLEQSWRGTLAVILPEQRHVYTAPFQPAFRDVANPDPEMRRRAIAFLAVCAHEHPA